MSVIPSEVFAREADENAGEGPRGAASGHVERTLLSAAVAIDVEVAVDSPHTLVPLPATLLPFAFLRPTVYKGRVREGSHGQCRRALFLLRPHNREGHDFQPYRHTHSIPTLSLRRSTSQPSRGRAHGWVCFLPVCAPGRT